MQRYIPDVPEYLNCVHVVFPSQPWESIVVPLEQALKEAGFHCESAPYSHVIEVSRPSTPNLLFCLSLFRQSSDLMVLEMKRACANDDFFVGTQLWSIVRDMFCPEIK